MRFEEVKEEFKAFKKKATILPIRSTKKSAGYDFFSKSNTRIKSGEVKTFVTDVKCKMNDDEVLFIFIRSSYAIKKGLVLANSVGVIDADYYENESNDGNIMIAIRNESDKPVSIPANAKIAQGVVVNYITAENDNAKGSRRGGIGSTGR